MNQLIPEKQRIAEIVSILENEKKTAQLFLEILHKEEAILTQGRTHDLDFVLSEKIKLMNQLETQDNERTQYFTTQGYPTDKSGIQQWLTRLTGDVNPHQLWSEFLGLMKRARQINQTNGQAITLLLQHNQRAYLALQNAAGNIALYGPKGQAFI